MQDEVRHNDRRKIMYIIIIRYGAGFMELIRKKNIIDQ